MSSFNVASKINIKVLELRRRRRRRRMTTMKIGNSDLDYGLMPTGLLADGLHGLYF